jgi:hypothetical protein
MGANFCVDGSTDRKKFNQPAIGYSCHQQGGNQVYMYKNQWLILNICL